MIDGSSMKLRKRLSILELQRGNVYGFNKRYSKSMWSFGSDR